MRNRGITLIEIVVIFAILVVIGVFLVPNIIDGIPPSAKTYEMQNLSSLVKIYTSGQTDSKPKPQSTGHRFWLALFVGDPNSSNDSDKFDIYAQPSQVSNLISSFDKGCLNKDQLAEEFQNFIADGKRGWDLLSRNDNLYTSYAGPKNVDVFTDKSNHIVGCTGSRNGIGFIEGGFAVVYADLKTTIFEYDDLEDIYSDEWTGDELEPRWNSTLLKNVINIEPSSNSQNEGR